MVALTPWRKGWHYGSVATRGLNPSIGVDKYRGAVRFGQERVDFISLPIKRQRVGARFRRHHVHAPHCGDIDDIYHSRIADGHVKAAELLVQKNHIRCAAERDISQRAP